MLTSCSLYRQLFPSDPSSGNGAKVDIIAVHGLNPRSKQDTEHAWDTWRTPPGSKGRMWLLEDLPEQVPGSRIFLYQYNSTAVYGKDRNTFVGKADEMLEAIRIERGDVEQRPIIFLCHSLGGLLVKQALINAHNNPKYTHIKTVTSGLAFFATPHGGGDPKLVRAGQVASKIATTAGFQKGDDLLEVLRSGSMFADLMQEHWRHQWFDYNIVSFWGAFDDIVPRDSARLGLPGNRENVVKLDADHRSVCKFGLSEADQDNWKLVRFNLKDLYRQALSTVITTETEKSHEPGRRTRETGSGPPNGHARHCLLPAMRNTNFTGRAAVLQELQQKLFIERGCRKLSIVGLGGVGKTQLALQLAYWVKENEPEYSIFWLPALSLATFTEASLEIAKVRGVEVAANEQDIKVHDSVVSDERDPRKAVQQDPLKSVQQHLNSRTAGRWLLIVDNADDVDVVFKTSEGGAGIYDYLPENDTGVTVFTTGFMQIGIDFVNSKVLVLDAMDPPDAEEFLRKSLIQKRLLQDQVTTRALLHELAYLPLAITQAAAYLNRNQASLKRYLELLHGNEQDLISLMQRDFRDSTRYEGMHNAVATTWLVSFDQIKTADPLAAWFLEFISCIEPKAIPRSMFPKADSEEEADFAIGTLCAYAFLVRRADQEVYDMHRLVQLASKLWVRRQNQTELALRTAVHHFHKVFEMENGSKTGHAVRRAYYPHVFRLIDESREYPSSTRWELLIHVAGFLRDDERYDEATVYLQEAVNWAREHQPVTDPFRLESEYSLSQAYYGNRKLKEAIPLIEHVVEVQKDLLGRSDPVRISGETLLARAYQQQGQHKEAIHIFEGIAASRKRMAAEDDWTRLHAEQWLALSYLADKRTAEAIQIMEHVVAIARRTHGKEDQNRHRTEHALARVYLQTGRLKEGILILEDLVAIRRKTLGEESRVRLRYEYDLAMAYGLNGQLGEEIQLMEGVVAVRETTLEEDHHSRLNAAYSLGKAYRHNGQTKEAIPVLEGVVTVRNRVLREEDFYRLITEHELARTYLQAARATEAMQLLQGVVAVRRRILSEDHRDRLWSEYWLASAMLARSRPNDETRPASDGLELGSKNDLGDANLREQHRQEAISILHHVQKRAGSAKHEDVRLECKTLLEQSVRRPRQQRQDTSPVQKAKPQETP